METVDLVCTGNFYAFPFEKYNILFRDPHTGKIIRACDQEASLGDSYEYEICKDVKGNNKYESCIIIRRYDVSIKSTNQNLLTDRQNGNG